MTEPKIFFAPPFKGIDAMFVKILTMIFNITPVLIETEEQPFPSNSKELVFMPFTSNIIGLKMVLYNANGKSESVPIAETNVGFSIDVSSFSAVAFIFMSADKDYVIELNFN